MEEIDTGYLLELQFLGEASIDMQFQAWMAISFAVIVASYSGRKDLALGIRCAIVLIYSMAAFALFARWITEIERLYIIQAVLSERGLNLAPVLFAPEIRQATYALGSLLTVAAVFYFGREKKSNIEENDT